MADPDTTEHHETISGGFNLSIQKRVIRDAQCGLKGDQSKHPLDQQAATSLNTITDDDQQEIQFDHDEYDDAMCVWGFIRTHIESTQQSQSNTIIPEAVKQLIMNFLPKYHVLMNMINNSEQPQIDFKIQGIYYLNQRTHRIQQNVGGGTCPLLALCNALFLNHQMIYYHNGGRRIKFGELSHCLTQHLQNMLNSVDSVDGHKPVKTELKVDTESKECKDTDTTQQIEATDENDASEELDINIKFSDACDFEENRGYRMFAHYGFKLFHGWVVDPKEEKLYSLIGDKSYDETIDLIISDAPDTASEEEKKELEDDKDIIRKFFAESPTQFTSYGLERLYNLMHLYGEDTLAIFVRNPLDNHFSTIVQHAGIIYELVTDECIVDADPQITWQTLLQISSVEHFVNNKMNSLKISPKNKIKQA
eukprot:161617_1